MSESKPDPFVGRSFDGYHIESVIGRGGMGTVYRAKQLSLGRPVAIKVLASDLADNPQFLKRFHREADALSRLSHPNVVSVIDRGDIDDRPYLVMEFVEGTSLRTILENGPLAPADALRIVSSVLAALDHAHQKGIVHRDIKPENVLLARNDVVKVADFGLSRLLDPVDTTRLTRTQLVLGTYEYMAPEQREHAREADSRSDLYATGVVLYELLCGELPIGRFRLPSERRPGVCDGRVDHLIEKSLDKDPDHRFQRASEMGNAVSAILERPSAEAPPPAPPRSAPAPAPGFQPFRFEHHLDNVATIDHVLGTGAYLLGFLMLFGIGRTHALWIGIPFFVFFLAGWYVREAAAGLRQYRTSARTSQAVIAIVTAFTGVLLPFSIYSLWVLFSHRGRTYYDARGRGLDEREAARHTYRMMSDPYGEFVAPAPPPAKTAPRPSEIPVQSIVTSTVEPSKPKRRSRTSPCVPIAFFVGLASVTAAFAGVPAHIAGKVAFVAAGFAVLGMVHSLFVPRVRGFFWALVIFVIVVASTWAVVAVPGAPSPAHWIR